MNEGDVVLLQNTRFRGKEETKNGEDFSKELADLCDVYVCDAFGSSHRAHASVAGVTDVVRAKGGECAVGYLMKCGGEPRKTFRSNPGRSKSSG